MDKRNTETAVSLGKWYGGDGAGLDALLDRHLSWIRSHVRLRLGPFLRQKDQSGDIVQDAMIQFLRYCPRIQISDDNRFRALMARIVENVLRDRNDWFKARRRAISMERPLPSDTVLNLDSPRKEGESPSQAAQQNEQEAWIRLALELLDPDDRTVIVLRDWDGLTFTAIGERIGTSYDTARMKYNRSFDKLTEKVWSLRNGNIEEAVEADDPGIESHDAP